MGTSPRGKSARQQDGWLWAMSKGRSSIRGRSRRRARALQLAYRSNFVGLVLIHFADSPTPTPPSTRLLGRGGVGHTAHQACQFRSWYRLAMSLACFMVISSAYDVACSVSLPTGPKTRGMAPPFGPMILKERWGAFLSFAIWRMNQQYIVSLEGWVM